MLSSFENMINIYVTKYFYKKQWKDMCLILFSYNYHPEYRLILASNRDEFYNRPTRQLSLWDTPGKILAGQDEKDHGTWLGVTPCGKIAGITNFRSPKAFKDNPPSRGLLVSDYLSGDDLPLEYMNKIMAVGNSYNGFNLLAGDLNSMFYYSNMGHGVKKLKSGIYGLSNSFLDTPWPKVQKGKTEFEKIIAGGQDISIEDIFLLLADKTCPSDEQLPETGMGLEWERILGPLFIQSEIYGTRTSTIITIDNNCTIKVVEKTFIKKGMDLFESDIVSIVL